MRLPGVSSAGSTKESRIATDRGPEVVCVKALKTAMRLNERGIMSDAAYHRFEDVWTTGVYYTDDGLI